MGRKGIAVSATVAAVVGIGLGVIIGYFSHPNTNSSSPNPEWITNMESFLQDIDESHVTDFLNGVQADNIRQNLMYFADTPHMATSPRDVELANFIKDTWKDQLDESYLTPYEVMHGFLSEDSEKPNSVSVVNQANESQYTLRTSEIVYEEYMKSPETIVPYYSAYGPPGDIQGKLIYGNYGSEDDFVSLLNQGVDVNDTIVLVRYGGGVGRGDKARIAMKYGVKGVLVYSDPEEWVVDGEKGYPEDSSLPGTGVQRGSTLQEFGDPTTPYYPSTNSSYRVPIEEINQIPPIPIQPIAYDDAANLLRDLGGPSAPNGWMTGLNVDTIHLGPGFASPNETNEVHLVANNIFKTTTTYNVIGIIRGSEEPDKYLMYGNHRDSWVYGAVDPSSGTACMMEITRVFGEMMKNGWRPRRTIMFASWGSEEFGLLGSTEWVEDNLQLLAERALVYINVDIAVFANQSFFARASPLLSQVLYDVTSKIYDTTNQERTLNDVWLSTFPNEVRDNPLIKLKNLFAQSASDPRYKISPYPTYHTGYDTFDYVDRFVDPGFFAHQKVARAAGSSLIHISDSLIIPYSLKFLSDFIQAQVTATETQFGSQITGHGLTLDDLKKSGTDFAKAVNDFQTYIDVTLNKQDPKQINAVNERILGLERCFIEPRGLPNQPFLRHISGSPGILDDTSGSFPGLQDALFDIEKAPLSQWKLVEQQLALVIYKVNSAVKMLQI